MNGRGERTRASGPLERVRPPLLHSHSSLSAFPYKRFYSGAQGEIKEEALSNIKEAIEGYLEVKAKLLNKKTKGEKAEVIVEAPSADNERVACGDNRRGWVKKGRISTAS